ncbi:class I SAM-dependent methyltransferase [bacterium]|nr:class I SAM-dependent methyltransferase [bacterium]
MIEYNRTAQSVFDDWAQDYHVEGMENGHWPAVRQIFPHIAESNGNYLEVGIGNGYGISHIAQNQYKHGQCYGLDISSEMAALTAKRTADQSNVHIHAGDFLKWQPAQGQLFDTIFSMEVFYYFASIQSGIEKAFSLLKYGGKLLLCVNFYEENAESHSWPGELDTPMELWNRQQYFEGFKQAGLKNITQKIIKKNPDDAGTLLTLGVKSDRKDGQCQVKGTR